MRPIAATAVCLALAASLAACDDGSEKKQDGEPHYVVGEGDTYVAFGDSYTAAPGTGDVAKDSGIGCSQTVVNYPHRIAEATGMTLQDHSCNGADTSDVLRAQVTPKGLEQRGPQIDGVDDDTDVITFRLGANDFGLIGRTFACALADARQSLGSSQHPCTDLDQDSPQGPASELMDDLETNVGTALQAISDRAPNARIFVIGYPQILPTEGTCDDFPLPAGDLAWAHSILDGFDDALRAGAETIHATYIDMAAASEGHDTCSDDPWMAGLRVPGGGTVVFHPYTTEGQAVAALVLKALES
jgi:GDSL-like lipase/acylhydrolase family protein